MNKLYLATNLYFATGEGMTRDIFIRTALDKNDFLTKLFNEYKSEAQYFEIYDETNYTESKLNDYWLEMFKNSNVEPKGMVYIKATIHTNYS